MCKLEHLLRCCNLLRIGFQSVDVKPKSATDGATLLILNASCSKRRKKYSLERCDASSVYVLFFSGSSVGKLVPGASCRRANLKAPYALEIGTMLVGELIVHELICVCCGT